MSQHRSESDVTDTFNILDRGIELVVDDDAALTIELDTDGRQVQALNVRAASNSNKNDVGF
jgi:hypothetical protein